MGGEPFERCLHGTDDRIAEGEVFFLRFADGVFFAEMADSDGGVIGRPGTVRSGVCYTILLSVMAELKDHRPGCFPLSLEFSHEMTCNPGTWVK